jgi:tripartite-type tricarboxylate transporter receptor subunit TctC
MEAAIQDPHVRRRFMELGAELTASAPKDLAKFVASELVKWREVIACANIPVGKVQPSTLPAAI